MTVPSTWEAVLQCWRNRLLVEGAKPRTIGGFTGSAKTAIRYFEEKSIEPGSVAQGSQPLDMATEIFATQKGPRGHAVMRAAQALIDECHKEPVSDDRVKQAQAERVAEKAEEAAARARAAAPAAKSSAAAARGNSVAATVTPQVAEGAEEDETGQADNSTEEDLENAMNRDVRDEVDEDQDETQDEVDQEGEEELVEDDVPPSRRKSRPRATVQQMAQPVFVMPPMGRMPKQKNAQPAQPRNRIVRPQSKVRIYKRGEGGRRSLINDYTADEIGNSLQKFLKEYVDPDYGEPSGVTRYEVVEVDDRDQERGAPANYTIESQPQQSNAPMDQLRDTVSLISELREIEEEKASKNAELMTAAKKQAMAGGDWSQMMMLMMMERMFAPKSEGTENVVLKVLEKIGAGGFNASIQPPVPALPPMQTLPPIPFHIPPPPPPTSTAMDKLLELAVAKMANPPSLADQLKELAMLKEIMGGSGGANVEMLAALRAMAAQNQQPREATGIDNAVSVFEKLHNVVKVLAPQVNMGGLTGALQGILTPKLTEVLGNTLADGMAKATGQVAGPAAQGALPQGQNSALPQTAPGAQAPAVPPEVHQKLVALNIAQTRPVQLEATVSLIQAMWESPVYKQHLEPVLAALLQGNVEPGQKIIVAILSDAKPILATVDFANDVLRLMAQKAGMPVPEALKVKVTDDVPGLAEPQNAKVIPLTQPTAEQPKPEAPAANGAAAVAAAEPPVTQPATQPASVQSTGRPS